MFIDCKIHCDPVCSFFVIKLATWLIGPVCLAGVGQNLKEYSVRKYINEEEDNNNDDDDADDDSKIHYFVASSLFQSILYFNVVVFI